MKRIALIVLLFGFWTSVSAQDRPIVTAIGTQLPDDNSYTFMEVGVTSGTDGSRMDEKFFVGRLPNEGEAVEMVFVGRNKDSGNLRFQLRVKADK